MTTFVAKFGDVFDMYDDLLAGEISPQAVCNMYSEMRPPGVRLAQVEAGLETLYGEGMGETLDKDDLEAALIELDRRFFLLKDLVWEFKILARADGLIEEKDAKLLFTATHEHNFSLSRYERWLHSRKVKGAGVPFLEIDVLLCNIPTPDEIIEQLPALLRERTEERAKTAATEEDGDKIEYMKRLQELKDKRAGNMDKRKSIGSEFKKSEDQRKLQEEEERKRAQEAELLRLEEERRRAEERERLAALQKEAEEKRRLQELKERAAREEEERRAREEEDRKRAAEEAAELERQRLLEEQRRKEEEEKRRLEEQRRRQEEEQRQKAARELEERKRAEEQALLDKEAAEAALKAAMAANDKAAIEDAERLKREAEQRAKQSEMLKRLSQAIKNRELDELEEVTSAVRKMKIPGAEDKLAEADELIDVLRAQQELRTACIHRSIDEIEEALDRIRAAKYETVLAEDVEEAEILLARLKRLEFLKRKIMELSQRTIAELKSYSQPPPIVKFVMTATFLILGHKAKEIKQWPQMVVLMGKTGKMGLKRRVQSYDPDSMPYDVAEACREILVGMDLAMVADVSAGAAAFFVWAEGMVEERLSLPKVIPQDMLESKSGGVNSSEKSVKYMRTGSGTVDVLSRRSRSVDKIESPAINKARSSKELPPQGSSSTRTNRADTSSRSPAKGRRRVASESPRPTRSRPPRK